MGHEDKFVLKVEQSSMKTLQRKINDTIKPRVCTKLISKRT